MTEHHTHHSSESVHDTPEHHAEQKKHPKNHRSLIKTGFLAAFAVIIVVCIVASASYFVYAQNYKNTIYPGVSTASFNMAGKSSAEALMILDAPISTIEETGLVYRFNDYDVYITPNVGSSDSGSTAYELMNFDENETVARMYAVGRNGTFFQNLVEQMRALVFGKDIHLVYTFKQQPLIDILKENFQEFEEPAQNAELYFENGIPMVKEEVPGKTFDYASLALQTDKQLSQLNTNVIKLDYVVDEPTIKKADADSAVTLAGDIAELAPITLTYEDKTWKINRALIEKALLFEKDSLQGVMLTFVSGPLRDYLNEINDEVKIDAKEGKFEIQDGQVVQIQESQIGKAIDIDLSMDKISEEVLTARATSIPLISKETQPRVTSANIQDLGIVEKIGEGRSNFRGSPRNRVSNIKNGTEKIHGTLIAPDEEFSLLSILRPFDASGGWLEELVIKGNKTTPEYGGGACQFGTTLFRGTMNSGLPVTVRQNHSYSVSYYLDENGLPGTDATIYDPAPDYKFLNDTGHYILIQGRIEGTELIYEFWGTKDGRVASQTKPVVSNKKQPPPKKIIETTDLAPGETKCTERAHVGMDASFDYKVMYPDGEEKNETFKSKYKAWQEVCLVGVDPNKVTDTDGADDVKAE